MQNPQPSYIPGVGCNESQVSRNPSLGSGINFGFPQLSPATISNHSVSNPASNMLNFPPSVATQRPLPHQFFPQHSNNSNITLQLPQTSLPPPPRPQFVSPPPFFQGRSHSTVSQPQVAWTSGPQPHLLHSNTLQNQPRNIPSFNQSSVSTVNNKANLFTFNNPQFSWISNPQQHQSFINGLQNQQGNNPNQAFSTAVQGKIDPVAEKQVHLAWTPQPLPHVNASQNHNLPLSAAANSTRNFNESAAPNANVQPVIISSNINQVSMNRNNITGHVAFSNVSDNKFILSPQTASLSDIKCSESRIQPQRLESVSVVNKEQSLSSTFITRPCEKSFASMTQLQNVSNGERLPPFVPFHCYTSESTNMLGKNSSTGMLTAPHDMKPEKLRAFLEKFGDRKLSAKGEKEDTPFSIAVFVSALRNSFRVLDELSNRKVELKSLLHVEDKTWNHKIKLIIKHQDMLCELLSIVSNPDLIKKISDKLERVKKKRLRLKRLKGESASLKEANKEKREKLHSEIDHFHEALKEKDIQRKREGEMKKEVDYILSEVRKKVKEAKISLEKLKVFEKLRRVRKDHAAEKGVLILPLHDRNFDKKATEMKEVLVKQLSDYENEEKALKVMLEIEQEDQLKAESNWQKRRLKEIQDRKHVDFAAALFGDEDFEDQDKDMFLFHDFYEAANKSVNNLLQIRHDWDIYLVPADGSDGSSIPQKWVPPSVPSSEVWQTALET